MKKQSHSFRVVRKFRKVLKGTYLRKIMEKAPVDTVVKWVIPYTKIFVYKIKV